MKRILKENVKYLLVIMLGCIVFFGSLYLASNLVATEVSMINNSPILATNIDMTQDFIYLSDLNWTSAKNGYTGSVQKDKGQGGSYTLSLNVDGIKRTYKKGLSIHANGQVIYNISELSTDYTHFVAQVGVDNKQGTKGSVKYTISVSNDGKNWIDKVTTGVLRGGNNAAKIDVDIEGYSYLRIVVNNAGDGNGNDHGTVGDAKLVHKGVDPTIGYYQKVHPVDYYDNILKNYSVEDNYNKNYRLVLERAIVNKIGYWNVQDFAEESEAAVKTLDWLFASDERLEQVIEVGNISNPRRFLQILSDLYNNSPSDFRKTTGNDFVYTKMIIALSATYTTDAILSPLKFSGYSPNYNYIDRYTVVKKLYDENRFMRVLNNKPTGNLVTHDWFKDYHIELIRMIMHEGMSANEWLWLNEYSHRKKSFSEYNVPYKNPNYGQAKLYAEENRELYTKKYYLDEFNIPYGDKVTRLWMVMAAGNVCWGQSRFAQTIYRANGIPAIGSYTPAHEPYITYYQDDNGNGYWTARYGNWTNFGTTWGGGNRNRLIFDWANKSFTDQKISGSKGATSSSYIYLAQANLNNYDKYKKSLYYNLIANSYSDNNKKIETYFKALEVNDKNLDSYDYLVKLYQKMSVKNGGTITSDDWYALAKRVTNSYEHFPVAMYDLLKVIRPYLEGKDRLDIDVIEKEKLTKATTISAATASSVGAVNMHGAIRIHAKQLLGKTQAAPATFSFDGANAGKIVLNPNYRIAFRYSIDGGNTYSDYETVENYIQIPKKDIEKITAENDIIIDFMGLPHYKYRIDITKGDISSTLYANDLENRVIGISLTYEWRNSEDEEWTSYAVASPNSTGDKTLYVRNGATGTKLPSESKVFTFTQDTDTDERKYVSINHLSVKEYSSQSVDSGRPFYAPNAIDGSIYTMWHTDFRYNVIKDNQPAYFIIEMDEVKYLSALEFIQTKYKAKDPNDIKNVRVLVSLDGETWEEAGRIENCAKDSKLKSIEFTESVKAKYVKLDIDTYDMFASLTMVNLYEDITKKPASSAPTAGIAYDITSPTTKNVVSRLVNPSTEIEILKIVDKYGKTIDSSGTDTYVFKENGEVSFMFKDKDGELGIATAKVDWIDREAPTGTIEYNISSSTNKLVIATLKTNEDVTVINNGDYRVDDDGNVLDMEGKIIEDYRVDENGYVLDSYDNRIASVNTFTYDFYANGEFIFEFVDKAGNKGTATAKVDWIDSGAIKATLSYDITKLTNKDVTVTIDFNGAAKITNNGGKKTYTFKKNGEFTFEFEDQFGNKGTATAKVDWIDKESSSNSNSNSTVNKPSNGNTNASTNTNTNSNSNTNSNNNSEIKYKDYSVEKIKVRISEDDIQENVILRKENLTLNDSLKQKFDSKSEYFELYLENDAKEKVNLDSSKVKTTIELDSSKEFLGLYEVINGTTKPLNYTKLSNNRVEVETEGLGKYVVSYKTKNEVTNTNTNTNTNININEDNEKSTNSIIWLIVGGIVFVIGILVVVCIKKGKES